MIEEEIEEDDRSVRLLRMRDEGEDSSKMGFTPEQHKAILAMLQQSARSHNDAPHNANQIDSYLRGHRGHRSCVPYPCFNVTKR